MKTKLIIIGLTFLGTTLFWCLVIVCTFWFLGDKSGVSFVEDARQKGYCAMMAAWNDEPRPVTFTVAELPTNAISVTPEVVLLERQLPPAGKFWVGIKKKKVGDK